MKTKNYIQILMENGIHFNTISKMNKNQVRILAEKFETKEAVTTTSQTGFKTTITPGSPANLEVGGANLQVDPAKGITITSKTKPVGTGETTESKELEERFESKAQQKLFFAKCGNGKTKEQKKWCRMRDEFAKSTTKKQYKKMPEKLHPEKTVKYRKNKTDEAYQKYLEERIFEMIEKHIEPSMTKGEIIQTLMEKVNKQENFVLKNPPKNSMFQKGKMKLPIGKLSSIGGEMKEDTKEKERTKEKEKTKTPTRKNPFKDPNPGVKEKPKADTKEKERTKEREKTKTPTRKNPFKDPNPGVKEKPKADVEKQKSDFMMAIKQAVNTK
jgi:hypothetical protein